MDPVDDDTSNKWFEDYTGAILGDETFPVYGHFNSGYPFLGFDEYTGDLVEEDLRHFRPDIECPDAERDPTAENPWNACYYEGACDGSIYGDAGFQFAFGSDASFVMPLS